MLAADHSIATNSDAVPRQANGPFPPAVDIERTLIRSLALDHERLPIVAWSAVVCASYRSSGATAGHSQSSKALFG